MKKLVAVAMLEALLAYRSTIGRGVSGLCAVTRDVADRLPPSEREVAWDSIQLGMILIAYRYLSTQEHTLNGVAKYSRSVRSMVDLPCYIPSEMMPKAAAILDSVWGQAIKDIKQLRQADIDWLLEVWKHEDRVVPYSKFIAACPRVGNAMLAGHAQAKVRKQVAEVWRYYADKRNSESQENPNG